MRLDLDGFIAAMFFFGMLGLVEQAAAQIIFNVPVGALAGIFASLMTAALTAAVTKGVKHDGGDSHGQPPKESKGGRTDAE